MEKQKQPSHLYLAAILGFWALLSSFIAAPGITGAWASPYTGDEALIVREHATGKRWSEVETLHLFQDPDTRQPILLQPGSSGEYAFTIENSARFPFHYTLHAEEENPTGAPMEYRLRNENSEYVAGSAAEWVDLTALSGHSGKLKETAEIDYVLEWRWSGEKDTIDTPAGIAAQDNPLYRLQLNITAEQLSDDAKESDDRPGNPSAPEQAQPGKAPQTSAQTNPALSLALMITSGILLLLVVFRRPREEDKEQTGNEDIS